MVRTPSSVQTVDSATACPTATRWAAVRSPAAGQRDRPLGALVEPRGRHRDPLVGERGAGQPPAVAGLGDHAVVGHEHVVEEHLVEQRLAGDLAQRPDVDARADLMSTRK